MHLGHANMAHHRGFQDEYYHDEHLIEQWNSVVKSPSKDTVIILGDVTMEKTDAYYQLDRLNGHKIVVLGNHDKPQHVPELLKYVDKVAGMMDYKGCALTHCPIHPSEICFYRANIHAHIHHLNRLQEYEALDAYGRSRDGSVITTSSPTAHKYINVDAKLIDFKPRLLEELLEQRGI